MRDLNLRYLRARVENLSHGESEAVPRPHPRRRDGRGGAPRGLAAHAARRVLPPPRRPGLPHGRLAGGDLRPRVPEYLQHLSRNLPESYLRQPRLQGLRGGAHPGDDGGADGRGGDRPHAGPAPRRRRLPVLEVGALGGRRAGGRPPAPESVYSRSPDPRSIKPAMPSRGRR